MNMLKKKNKKSGIIFDAPAAFHEGANQDKGFDLEKLREAGNMAMTQLSDDEKEDFAAMFCLASRGVTPEDYSEFYHIFQMSGEVVESLFEEESDSNDKDFFPIFGPAFGRKRSTVKEYEPLKDASGHKLVLKIQMKDVSKPPMWREVEIPADYNFLQLHEIIQAVTGLENYHLWQFNEKAYDDSLIIGIEMGENGFEAGLDFITHDAGKTPLTQFLQKKGDKLEYTYDFGDDWIFTVEVKDLIEKKNEQPRCLKFKSELNAIEDFGGPWAYIDAREDLDNWSKYSKKEREQRVEELGFDSSSDYLQFLNAHRTSLDDLNDALSAI